MKFDAGRLPIPVLRLLTSPALAPLRRCYRWVRDRTRAPETLAVCTYQGRTFHYPSRSLIGQYIAAGRGWDTDLRVILSILFRETGDAVVAEVGSNIGGSLLQMQIALPNARFTCFEPSDRFLPILRRNVADNGWSNVTIEPAILSSKVENVRLFSNQSTASVVGEDYGEERSVVAQEATTQTLDGYFAGVSRLDFIKTDTDGLDFDVLRGGSSIIAEHRPALYFEFDPGLLSKAGGGGAEFLEFLDGLGYRSFLVLSNFGEPLAAAAGRDEVLKLAAHHLYVDVLSLHPERPGQAGMEGAIFAALQGRPVRTD